MLGFLPFVLHDNRRGGVRPPVALVLSFAMRRDVENKEVPQSPQKKGGGYACLLGGLSEFYIILL